MSSTPDILAAARQLGQQIAEHEITRKLESALAALQADHDAQKALNDYNRHLQTVSEKEAANKPIEVEEKHQLETLQKEVVRNPLLRDFQTAQMDYVDLMRQVDQAITPPRQASEPE